MSISISIVLKVDIGCSVGALEFRLASIATHRKSVTTIVLRTLAAFGS